MVIFSICEGYIYRAMIYIDTVVIDRILQALTSAALTKPIRYILTGESGSGKTIWCERLIKSALRNGLKVDGMISPGVYADDRHIAIDLRNITSGETRRLAKLRSQLEPTAATKKWEMDLDTLAWGNRVLSRLSEKDVLVVDEIGPLELIHGDGLQSAFKAIDKGKYRIAVIVVRPSLLDLTLQCWPDSQVLRLVADGASISQPKHTL